MENRIFWLLVGILALYLVFSARGRSAVNRFLAEVFGAGTGSGSGSTGGTTPPAQTPPTQGDGPNPGQIPGVA